MRILYVFAQFPMIPSAQTSGPTVYETGGLEDGTNARRLGCRFIGRKILDLLISLVRHVGFILLSEYPPFDILTIYTRFRIRDCEFPETLDHEILPTRE